MVEEKLETAVGMSRKWDAREAGKEVARSTIEKLTTPPDFFLLFSTIHYEKHGGFQEFLNGVWDVLPEGTPLAGGTTAGFINNYGCFARGAVALAVSCPNIDVVLGVGNDTRKNPKKAAYQCSNQIHDGLKDSNFHNKLLIDIMPGPTRPSFPGIGSHWVISNPIIAKTAPSLLELSVKKFQLGQGLEDEVINHLAGFMENYIIFGGSSSDDNKLVNNYQFVGKEIKKHSLIGLGISTDREFSYAHSDGLSPTDITFKITKTSQGSKIIKSLDGKSASETFFGKIGIPVDILDDRILRTTFFYPLGYRASDNRICPNAIGCVLKDSLALNYSIKGDTLELFTASGKSLIGAVDEAIEKLSIRNPKFGLIISCLARLEALGLGAFQVKTILDTFFKNTQYLLLYMGGENTKFPDENPHHYNETFNILVS
jgi:hypothetical protein